MKEYEPHEILYKFAADLYLRIITKINDLGLVSVEFENSATDLIEFKNHQSHLSTHGFGPSFEFAMKDYFYKMVNRVLFIRGKEYYFTIENGFCDIKTDDDELTISRFKIKPEI